MSKLVNLFGNSMNHEEMNKKASLGVFVVVASFLLLAGSVSYAQEPSQRGEPQESAAEEAENAITSKIAAQASTTRCSRLGFQNNLNTPGIDTYVVRCAFPTQIRARVSDNQFGDNTFHVTNLCVLPGQRGRGDKEVASAGFPDFRNPSEFAETQNCQESIVAIECERHDACDSLYCVALECLGANFAPGFPVQRINK